MYLSFLGNSCFKIQTQDKETTLLFDPFDGTIGKLSKQQADILLSSCTRADHGYVDAVKQIDERHPFVINNPGEYEVSGVSVLAVQVAQDARDKKGTSENITTFSLGIEGVFIGHLGALNRALKESELEALGRIDVLILPVGGGDALSAKTAVEVISQIEPRIVIPCHYSLPDFKIDLDPLTVFLKESGMKADGSVDKIKITKKDLPSEDTQLVVLSVS